ncbi:acyl-CoA N-acyltransferase [Artomyces pyxidatus]|uniref:Acyl-CoA N-acyltransferase n=1 Tax=Artomyces pyxidatus TaxID=48021 RepID=A0ACB8SUE2_9AGAM|nr:acyl-CoA N-acyltransferase [Artomyces pyxidatus]
MFQTRRTTLRPLRDGDTKLLLDLWNDPEIQALIFPEFTAPRRERFVEETIAQWTSVPSFFAIVEDRGTGRFMGHVGTLVLSSKNRDGRVAITLGREWWGRGLGTEIMQWVVAYNFKELGLHRVSLMVLQSNERALAVYRRM